MPDGDGLQAVISDARAPGNVALPIEIHERIISFLDKHSLGTIATCALVCRTWLPFSRHTLYHQVCIIRREQWERFVRLLLNPPPHIAPYLHNVKELHIYLPNALDFDNAETLQNIGWELGQDLSNLVLNQCLPVLSGLTHISFDGMDWSQPWYRPEVLTGLPFQSLAELTLSRCSFSDVRQLEELVLNFHALTDLAIRGLAFNNPLVQLPEDMVYKGPPLKRLCLECKGSITELSQWLIKRGSIQGLSQLEWHMELSVYPEQAAVESFHTLLETIAGSLEVLSCSLHQFREVDLSRHHNLRELKVMVLSNMPLKEHVHQWKKTLGGLAASKLETLSFNLRQNYISTLECILIDLDVLSGIDAMLARPEFHRLRDFNLEILVRVTEYDIRVTRDKSSAHLGGPFLGSSFPRRGHRKAPSKAALSLTEYAEDLVRRKAEDALERANSRGILRLKVETRM